MKGELVDLTIFDVGAEVDLSRVGKILGQASRPAPLVTRSPSPPYPSFPAPLEIITPVPFPGEVPAGATVEVRLHPVGALVVRLRVPMEVSRLGEIIDRYQNVRLAGRTMRDLARQIAERVRHDVLDAFVEPYDVVVEPEQYRVFCLTEGAPPADELMRTGQRVVAALVTGEPNPDLLADGTVEDALKRTVRYYRDDAVVVGWDNAVLVGPPGSYEDALDVIELANLELLEFRTYDAYLDQRLDEAFQKLDRLWARGGLFRSARGALADISELRVDFARLTDTLHDTGKLFGEWYLAKLHQRLRDRFHLSDWEAAVAGKMATLEDMFQLAGEETNHRRGLLLETMIVVLFVLDLVLIYLLAQ